MCFFFFGRVLRGRFAGCFVTSNCGWIIRLRAAFLIHFPQLAPSREPYRPISGGPAIPSTHRQRSRTGQETTPLPSWRVQNWAKDPRDGSRSFTAVLVAHGKPVELLMQGGRK